ncbi:MAG: ATP-binding protein [Okeania sp. SIO3I5]|nr:ATP-binding protein [Okeania sp. SIO3I5]
MLLASGEAQRTIELLKDLLELARADNGQIHFHLEPLMLNDFVAEIVEMAKQCSGREIILKLGNGNNIVNLEAIFSESQNLVLEEKNDLFFSNIDKSNQTSSEMNLDDNNLGSGLSLKLKNIPQVKQNYISKSGSLSLIEVTVDRNRLKQVLLNLIDNAVKYSEKDSAVVLNLYRQNDEAIIQVCDRGQGIPLSQQGKIFERFYRGDEARNRAGNGAGLGLSIVKTLVEGMAGNIQVYSKLGEGSVFTVKLPVKN